MDVTEKSHRFGKVLNSLLLPKWKILGNFLVYEPKKNSIILNIFKSSFPPKWCLGFAIALLWFKFTLLQTKSFFVSYSRHFILTAEWFENWYSNFMWFFQFHPLFSSFFQFSYHLLSSFLQFSAITLDWFFFTWKLLRGIR